MAYSFGTIKVEAEIEETEAEKVTSFQQIKERYSHLQDKQKEHLYALYLNNDNTVIGDKLISLGQSVQTSLDIKDIARTAVLTDAEAVILIHNHPSGNSSPTESDLKATEQVQDCLGQFQIQLLDHIIISRTSSHSMKAENQLDPGKEVKEW